MRQNDLKTLRQVIREALRASGRGRRELETRLHLGRGNLERLTDGTMRITVRHLMELGELLDVQPTDFLALGCPESMAAARRRLTDWIAPGRPLAGGEAAAPAAAASVSREDIAAIVREEVRSALAAERTPRTEGATAGASGREGGEDDPAAGDAGRAMGKAPRPRGYAPRSRGYAVRPNPYATLRGLEWVRSCI